MAAKPEHVDTTARMMQMIWPGAFAAQAIYAAARLGIADFLENGPHSAERIAETTSADASSVRRLLRALSSLEIFREDDDGRFHQTPLSANLCSGSHVREWAIMLGSPFVWQPWGSLYDGIRTGKCAFDEVFATPFDDYMTAHPEEAEAYNAAMNAGAFMAMSAIAKAYDFSGFKIIVDVGGGRGALLAGILEANPKASGVLFDMPAVVAELEKLQVMRLGARCSVEGGDFFDRVPAGDALVLKSIIHSLSDEQAGRVLRNCRDALHPNGKLILVETLLEPTQERNPQKALMDLMMFVLTRGHERTAEQFQALLRKTGFDVLQIISTERGNSIIEAAHRS